jgi:hypothetical protein
MAKKMKNSSDTGVDLTKNPDLASALQESGVQGDVPAPDTEPLYSVQGDSKIPCV